MTPEQKLDRLIEAVNELTGVLRQFVAVLPDPDSLRGRILSRRVAKSLGEEAFGG